MKLFRYYNEEVGKRDNGWFVGVVIGCCFVWACIIRVMSKAACMGHQAMVETL